jgi:hypothetical protein
MIKKQAKQEKKKARRSATIWNDEMEIYIDPIDEWITENHGEWSEKYPGKYLAIVDCQVVAVEDTRDAAYDKLEQLYPERFYEKDINKVPIVWYVPREEEMEMIL